MRFGRAVVLLSCLSLACHAKRSAASIDRAAIQQVISGTEGQTGGETLLAKFRPLHAARKQPSSVARGAMTGQVRRLDTYAFGPSHSTLARRPVPLQPSKALLSANAAIHGTAVRQPFFGAPPKTVPFLRPGSNRRHSPVGMQMVFDRQGGPPAPPRGPHTGPGGDGDGRNPHFKILNKADAEYFLNDWMNREQVYRMEGSFGNAALADRHHAEITKLERLQRFVSTNTGRDPEDLAIMKMAGGEISAIVALYEGLPEDTEEAPLRARVRISAIANAEISKDGRVVVIDMVVNPAEVNDLTSKALIEARMARGFDTLGKTISEGEDSSPRHSPVAMNAPRVRQRASPARTASAASSASTADLGRDGDDGCAPVEIMSEGEAGEVLTDWIARAKVYKMTGAFGNVALADRHAAEIATLERLERHLSTNIGRDPEDVPFVKEDAGEISTFLALYDSSSDHFEEVPTRERARISAIASAVFSKDTGVLAIDLAVNPAEVNDLSPRARERMRTALEKSGKEFFGQ